MQTPPQESSDSDKTKYERVKVAHDASKSGHTYSEKNNNFSDDISGSRKTSSLIAKAEMISGGAIIGVGVAVGSMSAVAIGTALTVYGAACMIIDNE